MDNQSGQIGDGFEDSNKEKSDRLCEIWKIVFGFVMTGVWLMAIGVFVLQSGLFNLFPKNVGTEFKGAKYSDFGKEEILRTELPYEMFMKKTAVGIVFGIPKKWDAVLKEDTPRRFSMILSSDSLDKKRMVNIPDNYLQVFVEVVGGREESLEAFVNTYINSELKVVKKTEMVLGEQKYLVWKGEDVLTKENRDFEFYATKINNKLLLVRFYSPKMIVYRQEMDGVLSSIQFDKKENISIKEKEKRGLFDVFAESKDNIQTIKYQTIEVGNKGIKDSFLNANDTYQGFKVRGYTFQAIKNQRIVALADEQMAGSFVGSYLFDENYSLIIGPLDTRVEFTAPYSGNYYLLLVKKIDIADDYLLDLTDRNQTDYMVRIRDMRTGYEVPYPSWSEKWEIPFKDFAFVVDYNGNADPAQVKPKVYAQTGTLNDFNKKAFFPEESEFNLERTRSIQLDPDTVVVMAENEDQTIGIFPDKNQVEIVIPLSSKGGNMAYFNVRTFTSYSSEQDLEKGSVSYQSPSGNHKILVIMYDFLDSTKEGRFTKEEVSDAFFGTSNSLGSYYSQMSGGKLTFSGDVLGWYTVDLNTGQSCISAESEAKKAAVRDGVNTDLYSHIVYITPNRQQCGTSSASTGGNPSSISLNGTLDRYVLTHEMGHNLMLGHANFMTCGGKKSIDIYDNCSVLYYGDYWDPMGNSLRNMSAVRKEFLGWLSPSKVIEATESGDFVLGSLEGGSDLPVLLKFKKKDTNDIYYIEYRTALGLDQGIEDMGNNGTQIRIGYRRPFSIDFEQYISLESYLLDATPEDGMWYSFALSDGKSFVDERNWIKLTQMESDGEKVKLRLEYR